MKFFYSVLFFFFSLSFNAQTQVNDAYRFPIKPELIYSFSRMDFNDKSVIINSLIAHLTAGLTGNSSQKEKVIAERIATIHKMLDETSKKEFPLDSTERSFLDSANKYLVDKVVDYFFTNSSATGLKYISIVDSLFNRSLSNSHYYLKQLAAKSIYNIDYLKNYDLESIDELIFLSYLLKSDSRLSISLNIKNENIVLVETWKRIYDQLVFHNVDIRNFVEAMISIDFSAKDFIKLATQWNDYELYEPEFLTDHQVYSIVNERSKKQKKQHEVHVQKLLKELMSVYNSEYPLINKFIGICKKFLI